MSSTPSPVSNANDGISRRQQHSLHKADMRSYVASVDDSITVGPQMSLHTPCIFPVPRPGEAVVVRMALALQGLPVRVCGPSVPDRTTYLPRIHPVTWSHVTIQSSYGLCLRRIDDPVTGGASIRLHMTHNVAILVGTSP